MSAKSIMRLLAFLLLVAIIVWVGVEYRSQLNLMLIRGTVHRYGMWAPVIFIAIYVLATILFLPGLIVTLAGGLLFGVVQGALYNITGAVLGATIAFYISRYIASDFVAKKTGGKLKLLVDGVNRGGWKYVAILRLMPLLPFNLLNYALGLTRISGWSYIWASAVFMLPGTIAYTYVGALGEQFIRDGGQKMVTKIVIGVGLLILVSLIPWFIKKFKGATS